MELVFVRVDSRVVGRRLVCCLTGGAMGIPGTGLPENPVIVADNLSPSDTEGLDATRVSAMVLDRGGATSHTAILVRALGIPAVMAVGAATKAIADGDVVVVDGDSGGVIVTPDDRECADCQVRVEAIREEKRRLMLLCNLPSVTADGRRVQLAANIGGPNDTKMVKECDFFSIWRQ